MFKAKWAVMGMLARIHVLDQTLKIANKGGPHASVCEGKYWFCLKVISSLGRVAHPYVGLRMLLAS